MIKRHCLLLLASVLVAGCSSVGPMPAEGVPPGDEVSKVRERFADDLRGDIQIETPVIQRTDQNLLRVNVPIRNISGQDLQLLVQVQFLDETGSPYNDETNRRLFLLPRGSTKAFSATSGQSIASDYVLHVWRAE
jgi:uncharacterized protein YcfL